MWYEAREGYSTVSMGAFAGVWSWIEVLARFWSELESIDGS